MASPDFEVLRRQAPLTDLQLDRFRQYLELLLRWNKRINLTAVRDPAAIVERHFADSLAVLRLLEGPGRLIDVGSGAGLPGIPLAIARPDLQVTLLESVGKKAAFLRAIVHALRLSSTVAETRLEQFTGGPFDYAISRATFAPSEWVERARPLVRPGGLILVMSGNEEPPPGADQVIMGEHRHFARYRST